MEQITWAVVEKENIYIYINWHPRKLSIHRNNYPQEQHRGTKRLIAQLRVPLVDSTVKFPCVLGLWQVFSTCLWELDRVLINIRGMEFEKISDLFRGRERKHEGTKWPAQKFITLVQRKAHKRMAAGLSLIDIQVYNYETGTIDWELRSKTLFKSYKS